MSGTGRRWASRRGPAAVVIVPVLLAMGVLASCSAQAGQPAIPGDAAPATTQPGEPLAPPGRIALSADGNQHDQDDWAGTPMSLAMLAQRNLQPNLVHFDYNNHIWDSDEQFRENETESAMGGGERFGFDTSRFYDDTDPEQLDEGVANLTAEINASSPDDELWLVLAGPMETAWMALNAADPQARKSVKCLSHGEWNETHGQTDHGGHSYDDLIDLGCQEVHIPDQNSNLGETDMSDWDYLNDLGDNMQWLYSRIDLHRDGDVSDAGMVYYVITGEKRVTRSELRDYLTS
jgi:hypothetical protein